MRKSSNREVREDTNQKQESKDEATWAGIGPRVTSNTGRDESEKEAKSTAKCEPRG